MRLLATLDPRLTRLSRGRLLALSAGGALLIGSLDYVTGYEISMSVFYLAPVALAAWYGGRRAGGALILPKTNAEEAAQVASKLLHELRDAREVADFGVTCSVGVVTFLEPPVSIEQAISAVDDLMYRAKRGGKNALEFCVAGATVPGSIRSTPSPGGT
ncbi:MAG: diguanylate cyclase [Acetobacteraceae bacterium]